MYRGAVMEADVLAGLGVGFLGSRLKRLAERLQADATEVLKSLDMPIQPGQLSMLLAIRLHGPPTIGELAERLRLSQPTVTRAALALEKEGLVEARRSPEDQRSKRLALTP